MSTIPQIDQEVYVVPSFTLECGAELREAPIAYKTWGRLNEARDNVMDWWGPLLGRNKAFDPTRFFIFCANTLGSPYGSASPVTTDPETGRPYGPAFPPTSIRDDVRIHQLVLMQHLGVRRVAVVIGGSMGGMAALEWPLVAREHASEESDTDFGVHRIVVLASAARHSAWCIAWGESQRQSIYSDPSYKDGYYAPGEQPRSGLAAARMCALLTYRSRDSFERRFGRRVWVPAAPPKDEGERGAPLLTPPASPSLAALHNDGQRSPSRSSSLSSLSDSSSPSIDAPRPPIFSAQSYLRYQGDKFIARFDANCYIHLTRKMDTHDVTRERGESPASPSAEDAEVDARLDAEADARTLAQTLGSLPPHALVISIKSDGLFTPPEQTLLAAHIPRAELVVVPSGEGHDGFLVEFEEINRVVVGWVRREFTGLYQASEEGETEEFVDLKATKESVFGEAEVDFTRW
ncbi:Alpha/Beta hydrolase protein [Mycena galericulata]|nr:Alpha/Beta hydrolase protein [Mycena galericulata]